MSEQTWKSARIIEAEARFDVAVASLEATLAEVDQRFADRPETGLSDADIRMISEYARSAAATPEQRALQARIDAGELSWREITSGEAAGREGVREALEAGLPQMKTVYTLLEEGHSIDDVIDAGTPGPTRPRGGGGGGSGGDDGDGGGGFVLRNRSKG